jgi:serine/threonine protein kinase
LFIHSAELLKRKLYQACHQLPPNLLLQGIIGGNWPPVGGGGFADIFKASYGGKDVALKRPRTFGMSHQDQVKHVISCLEYWAQLTNKLKQILCEVATWENLQHPYVLQFLGLDIDTQPGQFPCIVTPWMKHGTIMNYIKCHAPPLDDIDGLVSCCSITPVEN